MRGNAISVTATGVTVTTTISTSAGGTLPVTSAGTNPRYVRVIATGTAYFRMRVGATTAVTTDLLVNSEPVILEVHGNTHYAVIDDGVSVKVNISPLEDR